MLHTLDLGLTFGDRFSGSVADKPPADSDLVVAVTQVPLTDIFRTGVTLIGKSNISPTP